MTYLRGRISTLTLHIDLTEQRRRHADEDGLKGSDGQMGKTYWDKKSGGCLEGWDILQSLIIPPWKTSRPFPVYTFKYTDSANIYIKMMENCSRLFKCMTGMRTYVDGGGWQPKKEVSGSVRHWVKRWRVRWQKKRPGRRPFGCGVRWVHGFQAECQADWRYLGGLTDGREGQEVDDGGPVGYIFPILFGGENPQLIWNKCAVMHNKAAARWLESHPAASVSPLLFSASTTLCLFDSAFTDF